MKKYIYPVVICKNADMYSGYTPDVEIFAEGETLEKMHSQMEQLLSVYLRLSEQFELKIEKASSQKTIAAKWPGYQISSIEIEI